MIDLWTARLSASPEACAALRELLAPDELARAGRFAFEHLRTAFVIGRGTLRTLLARYLRCDDPRALQFETGPYGKPALAGDARLRFNVSHSGNLALYAVAWDCEVGVDVEKIRSVPDLEGIARRFFSPAEHAQLMNLPDGADRTQAFFRCWTRKEAYVKALGGGLSLPLDRFQVTLLPDEPAGMVAIHGDPAGEAAAWTLHHLTPETGYLGAVAYRGAHRELAPRGFEASTYSLR